MLESDSFHAVGKLRKVTVLMCLDMQRLAGYSEDEDFTTKATSMGDLE